MCVSATNISKQSGSTQFRTHRKLCQIRCFKNLGMRRTCRVEIGRVLSKLRWSGAFHANFRRKTSFHTSDLEGCTRYYGFIHVPHLLPRKFAFQNSVPVQSFAGLGPSNSIVFLGYFHYRSNAGLRRDSPPIARSNVLGRPAARKLCYSCLSPHATLLIGERFDRSMKILGIGQNSTVQLCFSS